jgi:hypothetical protein
MKLAGVPVTAVDHHRDARACKDKINFTAQALDGSLMQPVTQTSGV